MPNRDTPPRLVEAWLNFHRQGLCRSLDAVFAFVGQGMEVWCRGEESGTYRKFQKIMEPLRDSYGVDLYVTRPSGNNPGIDDVSRVAPPSLVENLELRSRLRPGMAYSPPRVITYTDSDGQTHVSVIPDNTAANMAAEDRAVGPRLISWANSVMENRRIMRQYAADIPELLSTAFEPVFGATIRGHARDICIKHAKDLEKSIRDLKKELSHAFPKQSVKNIDSKADKKETKNLPPPALSDVMGKADELVDGTRVLAGRIYRFIYPAQHTVDLDELQNPGLLVSLDVLAADIRDFEQALAKLRYTPETPHGVSS